MKKVKFTQMKDGTKEDYLLLEKHEKKFIEETPSRILKYMSSLTSSLEGYQVSRLEHFTLEGEFKASFGIPAGSKPCGIDFIEWKGRSLALIGSLDDPNEDRPAPIYILDAETYEVLSTVRPKEDLKIELAEHIHNTIWYTYKNELYLICQAWNPGYYFVLQLVA